MRSASSIMKTDWDGLVYVYRFELKSTQKLSHTECNNKSKQCVTSSAALNKKQFLISFLFFKPDQKQLAHLSNVGCLIGVSTSPPVYLLPQFTPLLNSNSTVTPLLLHSYSTLTPLFFHSQSTLSLSLHSSFTLTTLFFHSHSILNSHFTLLSLSLQSSFTFTLFFFHSHFILVSLSLYS